MSRRTVKHDTQGHFVPDSATGGMKFESKSDWKFIKASQIKPIQLGEDSDIALREKYGALINFDGVEFIVTPNGWRGVRLTLTDGTQEYYIVNQKGKFERFKMTEYGLLADGWWSRVERWFGISDKMRATADKKINYIHLLMFLLGTAIVGGIAALGAWFIHTSTL